jgi:hypothetical protein
MMLSTAVSPIVFSRKRGGGFFGGGYIEEGALGSFQEAHFFFQVHGVAIFEPAVDEGFVHEAGEGIKII